MSTILDKGLHGNRLSTLVPGEAENEDIDTDLICAVRDRSLSKVPLDQGSFDERQSKLSIGVSLLAVGQHFERNNIPDESMVVCRALRNCFFELGVSVEWGEEGRVEARVTIGVTLECGIGYHLECVQFQSHSKDRQEEVHN